MKKWIGMAVILGSVGTGLWPGGAHAALVDLGNGLVYDQSRELTWLQDWNQGAGSFDDDGEFAADGLMTWGSAQRWADSLVYAGHDDWRLPTSDLCSGFNCRGSELGHLWHDALGNDPASLMGDTAPFVRLQSGYYWSGREWAPEGEQPYAAWAFLTYHGFQSPVYKFSEWYAVAVRDGHVSLVPEPASAACLLAGLALLLAMRLRSAPRSSHYPMTESGRELGFAMVAESRSKRSWSRRISDTKDSFGSRAVIHALIGDCPGRPRTDRWANRSSNVRQHFGLSGVPRGAYGTYASMTSLGGAARPLYHSADLESRAK